MSTNAGFELHGLQKLFVTFVTAQNHPERFLFDPEVLREYVVAEVARVKHRLIEKALTIEGEDAVRRYVRIHQYAVVVIMDKLFERRDHPGAMECCEVLDDLLLFFNEHFPQYFDEMGKAPSKHIHETRIEIGLSFGSLEKNLCQGATFEPLIFIILDPLHRFYTNGDGQRVSFNRIRFLHSIMDHSKKVAQNISEKEDPNRALIELLIYLNYNSRKTIIQFVNFLRDLLPDDLDRQSKHGTLSEYLRFINQTSVKPNTGYHPYCATLKKQLVDYLTLEINALPIESDFRKSPDPTPEFQGHSKTKLDLSVAQLGCLLRVLADTGIISSANMSALIRCIALHCETKRSSSISAESLRVKFYDVEAGTQQAVRTMLQTLLKSVEKMSASS